MNASFIVDIGKKRSAEPLAQAFRNGWNRLRFHHPSIAIIASEKTRVYDISDFIKLERWAAETFISVTGHVAFDNVIPALRPRGFATLYYLEEHAGIVLSLFHWRIDGVGAFHLLNAYLRAVAESKNITRVAVG